MAVHPVIAIARPTAEDTPRVGYGDGYGYGHGSGACYGDGEGYGFGTIARYRIGIDGGKIHVGCLSRTPAEWAASWRCIAADNGIEIDEDEARAIFASLGLEMEETE